MRFLKFLRRVLHTFSPMGLVCVAMALIFCIIAIASHGNVWCVTFSGFLAISSVAMIAFRENELAAVLLFIAFALFSVSSGSMGSLSISGVLVLFSILYAAICIPCLLEFERRTIDVNPDFDIDLAEDEVVIRCRKITELDFSFRYGIGPLGAFSLKRIWANGYAIVTNRRLLYAVDNRFYRVLGMKNRDVLVQQVYVEDISSIDYSVSTAKSPIWYGIVTMIAGICGAVGCLFSKTYPALMIDFTLIILGLLWFLTSKKPSQSMSLGVRTKSKGNYGMFVSEMSRGYAGSVSCICRPAESFAVFVSELGAISLDLQKYGDDAIEKWMD